jgi:hypothetical protein
VSYRKGALADDDEGSVEEGDAFGGILEVPSQLGERLEAVSDLLGGESSRGHGCEAGNDESSETHLENTDYVKKMWSINEPSCNYSECASTKMVVLFELKSKIERRVVFLSYTQGTGRGVRLSRRP